MELSGILMAFVILLFLVAGWFGLYYLGNPPLEDADSTVKITGNCGDTMELALRFKGDTVQRTRHWTDGCSVSNQCIEAAAMLAGGKTISELKSINMMHIMEITGQLPESHLHCAQLAETTLQLAVKEYLKKLGAQS
ncbi:iron-sulfur cluster assembly scaffold protein [Desulfosediminicola flagellatus]|uniref:iron-sulfur cluster assembly scaffold protein n=1 Tax=Desulfosediminicola flagellatus TaxID=2569541 RepID=UPI0010ABCE38|nr:iron-sulfur cluster assembly scaffold protein [Desulfosediminicola flagellatus]